jgi:hypothetical protein
MRGVVRSKPRNKPLPRSKRKPGHKSRVFYVLKDSQIFQQRQDADDDDDNADDLLRASVNR